MKKPIMLAGIAAVVLVAAGYFLVLPKLKGKPAAAAEDNEPVATAAAHRKTKRAAAEPGLIYPLPERVLNLAGPAGVPHYARIELALEFARPQDAKPAAPAKGAPKEGTPGLDPALEPVTAYQAQIDDAIVRIVGSKTVDQMTSTEGKDALKQEILDTVGEMVPKPELTNVYIVRLIVQ